MSIIEKAVSKLEEQSTSPRVKEDVSRERAVENTVQKVVAGERIQDEQVRAVGTVTEDEPVSPELKSIWT